MVTVMKITIIGIAVLFLLSGCSSDNEHFCARYAYVYDQLDDPTLPTYGEMKSQLLAKMAREKGDDDQSKFMLFVLEDHHNRINVGGEDAQAFCMRIKRWESYH